MKEKRSKPNKSLHPTSGADAPLADELNRYGKYKGGTYGKD